MSTSDQKPQEQKVLYCLSFCPQIIVIHFIVKEEPLEAQMFHIREPEISGNLFKFLKNLL